MAVFLDAPRGLRSPERLVERRALLETAPAVQPLRAWASALAIEREERLGAPVLVPHFDPAEAGEDARVLVLMEAPGPMTNAGNARPGSGFISADNDDATAENCWRTRQDVGLDTGVLHWNAVPWYLGVASRKPTPQELAEGGAALVSLIDRLPNLEVVVLCGLYAQRSWQRHVSDHAAGVESVNTWHPSPLALKQPGKRDEFRAALAHVAGLVRP